MAVNAPAPVIGAGYAVIQASPRSVIDSHRLASVADVVRRIGASSDHVARGRICNA